MTLDTLKIKKLHPDATIPTRAHETDAGLDLYAVRDMMLDGGDTFVIRTGIAVDIPPGYEAQVRPRSGMTLKTPIKVQLGTIDSGYTGDVGVIAWHTVVNGARYMIKKGDKIAQLVIQKVELPTVLIVDEFDSISERGANGFGSTDR